MSIWNRVEIIQLKRNQSHSFMCLSNIVGVNYIDKTSYYYYSHYVKHD